MALEPLLVKKFAEYLDVSVSKLRRDREKNRNKISKIGNLVRYPITAIKEYQAENTVNFSSNKFENRRRPWSRPSQNLFTEGLEC